MEEELKWVPCIWYLVIFKNETEALQDSQSEVNIMSQTFASQLGLKIWKTNIKALKIDDITLKTYGMVVSTFFILDKDKKVRFFEKTFLLVDFQPDVILEKPFLTMSNIDIDF